jgi:hypothetical protein
MIKATILADSKNPWGDRLTTMLITFPRIILAEFNTHRMFSRNSASSIAVPFEKMIKSIEEYPFVPMAFQKNHKGMQGTEYFTGKDNERQISRWYKRLENRIEEAKEAAESGLTKQLVNRSLEEFMWTTVVVSASEWENFFALRCPRYQYKKDFKDTFENAEIIERRSKKDLINAVAGSDPSHEIYSWDQIDWLTSNVGQAEIHMMALAEAMWDAYNESTPKKLEVGDWHIPYNEKVTEIVVKDEDAYLYHPGLSDLYEHEMEGTNDNVQTTHLKVDVSTMMCARTSYTVLGDDGKEWRLKKYLEKCKELKEANPFHASPFEHCAIVPTKEEYDLNVKGELDTLDHSTNPMAGHFDIGIETIIPDKIKGWFGNFKGFKAYRKFFDNENIKV